MPYIEEADRNTLNYHIDYLSVAVANSENQEGELNYCISRIVHNLLKRKGLNYKNLNAMIGVLECAKLECYRRLAIPYEDVKIEENGDVYGDLSDYRGE